ncbi:MAG: AMP-binding protein, partial [Janthinobacterium lividum]
MHDALPAASAGVHGPLQHWAARRPAAIALDDGRRQFSFAQLAQQAESGARALAQRGAASICWVDDAADWPLANPADMAAPLLQLSRFFAILSSRRTAAVGSPDWPPLVRQRVWQSIAALAPAALPEHRRLHGAADHVAGAGPANGTAVPCERLQSLAHAAFYIGFTSGSSGLPKGFRRSHQSWTSSFEICLQTFGAPARETVLVPGPLSHSLFLFGALLGIWTGAGARLLEYFSAATALAALARGEAGAMVAV